MGRRHLEPGTRRSLLVALLAALFAAAGAVNASAGNEAHHAMTLHSATFVDGRTLPLSMINTIPDATGQNTCTASGAPGGNESRQLTWRRAPPDTRSFVIIAYDVTAQFTHWHLYNIPADTTSLPQNAGIPGSVYGAQSGDDFCQANYSAGPEGLYQEFIEASRHGHGLARVTIAGYFSAVVAN
jgi:phosphatidylethanolamine-binding protein (PEBP) family uncharacterized protein